MKITTDEEGVVLGILKGHKWRNGGTKQRHEVRIQDYTKSTEPSLGDERVWVAASPEGDPALGAYVERDKFLKMISGVLHVYIEDINNPMHMTVWHDGKQTNHY